MEKQQHGIKFTKNPGILKKIRSTATDVGKSQVGIWAFHQWKWICGGPGVFPAYFLGTS